MNELWKLRPLHASYRFFGGGGGSLPKVEPAPPTPVRVVPEVEKAKSDLREKLRRRRGRAASLTGFGMYDVKAPTVRPILSEKLGAGPYI